MTTTTGEIAKIETPAQIMERVIAYGDLSKLTAEERVKYYGDTCASLGLNPLTRPLEYLTLNGKVVLYARRDCTDQLRALHNVSVKPVAREVVEGVYVVTMLATIPGGREDTSIGAVPIENVKGEARANAMMKCETKAKRRVTLSICGLGFLDETEVETIPGAIIGEPKASNGAQEQAPLFLIGGDEVAPDRSRLLAELTELGDRLGLDKDARKTWYAEFCRDAKPDRVDVALLSDLVAALKKRLAQDQEPLV